MLSSHYRFTRACTLVWLPMLSFNVQRTHFTTKNFLNALFLFYIADFEAKQNCEAYARKTNTILTLSWYSSNTEANRTILSLQQANSDYCLIIFLCSTHWPDKYMSCGSAFGIKKKKKITSCDSTLSLLLWYWYDDLTVNWSLHQIFRS